MEEGEEDEWGEGVDGGSGRGGDMPAVLGEGWDGYDAEWLMGWGVGADEDEDVVGEEEREDEGGDETVDTAGSMWS